MRITALVKGTPEQARTACLDRGIGAELLHYVPTFNETLLQLDPKGVWSKNPEGLLGTLHLWNSSPARAKLGVGFPVGTLLLYTVHGRETA